MSIASFIFSCLENDWESYDEEPISLEQVNPDPVECACNNCGRTFHPTWLHHWCPARCGGRVYARS